MKKQNFIVFALMGLIFFFHLTKNVSAAELIINGGFETGNFTGWTVVNGTNSFVLWNNTAANGSTGFHTSSPQEGTRSVWNGVAANANSPHLLYQDVAIPAASTAQLQWKHRFQLDHSTFCGGGGEPACGTAQFAVEILNTSNVLLQTLYVFNVGPEQIVDTGWFTGIVNISAYAGNTIRLRFRNVTSNTFVGPGMAEIDAVSILSPTAANVPISGRIFDSGNSGMSKVAVTLTDVSGISQTVYSNSFGYYKFNEVQVGQTYILTVNHRKYLFPNSPRVISVDDAISDLDFQASP